MAMHSAARARAASWWHSRRRPITTIDRRYRPIKQRIDRRGGLRTGVAHVNIVAPPAPVHAQSRDVADVIKGANGNVAEIHNQALMMLAHEILDPETNKRVLVDHAFTVAYTTPQHHRAPPAPPGRFACPTSPWPITGQKRGCCTWTPVPVIPTYPGKRRPRPFVSLISTRSNRRPFVLKVRARLIPVVVEPPQPVADTRTHSHAQC
jgi:hypothetical protein